MKKRIKYKDGSEYSGTINENKQRHGKGKINFISGEKFVGEWKLDKKDGFGIHYNTEGNILKRGFWLNDNFLKKTEYFLLKEKKQTRDKYNQLYNNYIEEKNAALDGYGDEPEEHPFENAPKDLMDDEEFLLKLIENDNYAEIEFFQYTSERLQNDKDFVMKIFSTDTYFSGEKTYIGAKLRNDVDVIIKAGLSVFKEFGDDILNSKEKLYKIIQSNTYKNFYDWGVISSKIRSDNNFFIDLSKLINSSHTLKWATASVRNDKKVIESYLKKSGEAIKYVNKKNKFYDKYVALALKKQGSLITELDKKFKKIKYYVRIASKTYPEILQKIDKDLKKDKQIVITCLNQKPELIKFADNKFKADKKIVLNFLSKKPSILKYVDKKFKKDKKIFLFLFKKYFKKLTDGSYSDESPLKYFDKKITFDTKIITLLIDKRGKNASYASIDAVVSTVCNYVNKTKNLKILMYALNKSEYYFSGLSEKIRADKKITLEMVKHGNIHIYAYILKNLKKDPDVLEAAEKKFSEGFINYKTKKRNYNDIKDLDSNDNLYWDLYWYIYYKKNPDKITNETEHASGVRIKSFNALFEDYDEIYYSGEMVNGRPHGQGYASNEESTNHGDYLFIRTYEGEWKDGLPHGKGEYKEYEENCYPPNGETKYDYKGEFMEGVQIPDGNKT